MKYFVIPDQSISLIKSEHVKIAANKQSKIVAVLISEEASWLGYIDAFAVPHVTFGDTPEKRGKRFYGIGDVHKFHAKRLQTDPSDQDSANGLKIIRQIYDEVVELQQAFDAGDIGIYDPDLN